MLLFSKPTQYALRALSFLVRNQDQTPCRGELIAREEEIPKHFLSKLLQQLVQAKILNSTKGPNGGFSFARDPETITLYQVINVYEDLETRFNACAIGWTVCSDEEPCSLHKNYTELRERIRNYLENVNLATFVEVSEWKKDHPE
ncbi:MAG: Rrf2 family transcriptional regulator [Gemmatimonadetes bacterium]|nr:MAG: Rrf2 family transcriptional regulator [Gemmatimonadota bacterium]